MVSLERGAPLSSGNKSWSLSGVGGPRRSWSSAGREAGRCDLVLWCKQKAGQRSALAVCDSAKRHSYAREWNDVRWYPSVGTVVGHEMPSARAGRRSRNVTKHEEHVDSGSW